MKIHGLPRLALGFLLGLAPLMGQNVSWGAEADFNSRNVWRGIAWTHGPVFQPAAWASWGNTTVSVWSNMPLSHEARRGEFDQVFFSLTHEIKAGRWKLEPAVQGYYWQGLVGEGTAKTLELAFRASTPVGPLRFVTSHTGDVATYRGACVGDAGLEGKRIWRGLEWEANGVVAWANSGFKETYAGAGRSGLSYAQWGAAATRRARQSWYWKPHAEFVVIVDPVMRRSLGNTTLFSGGIALGWN